MITLVMIAYVSRSHLLQTTEQDEMYQLIKRIGSFIALIEGVLIGMLIFLAVVGRF